MLVGTKLISRPYLYTIKEHKSTEGHHAHIASVTAMFGVLAYMPANMWIWDMHLGG